MSEQDNCPNGRSECDFEERHELALAGRVLRMIEGYTKDNAAYPCPKCLRNSMMAIAALLHIEAEKMEQGGMGEGLPGHGVVEGFAEAARERILSVMDAVADFEDVLRKRRLM